MTVGLLLVLSIQGCARRVPDYGDALPVIVPSPFPANYAWALMTFDGALTGEESIAQPQHSADQVNGRYGEKGILVDFGHGRSSFRLELRPLSGTGRYLVDKDRGHFSLALPQGTWDTSRSGICSFNFTKVAGPTVPLVPPVGGEIFDVDIGFVCAAVGSTVGGRDLTITDGRLHAFLIRFPEGRWGI